MSILDRIKDAKDVWVKCKGTMLSLDQDDVHELWEEIERLNNRIEKAIDFLKENACIDEDEEYFCDDLRYDDCKTLLEILKGAVKK